MSARAIIITTTRGREITRRTEAAYVAAAEKATGAVSFHTSHAAAKRAAGFGGTVHTVAAEAAPAASKTTSWMVRTATGEVGPFEVECPPDAMAAARAAGHTPTGAHRV